jgi:periplasmic protein CpxP/Spy
MFKHTVIFSISLWLGVAASAASAQDATPRFPAPEQVVQYLSEKLSLSADQKTAIEPIIAERQSRIKAALAENNAGTPQRRREMMGIFRDGDGKIKTLLTPDQQQKYAEVERQMIEQMKQRAQSK